MGIFMTRKLKPVLCILFVLCFLSACHAGAAPSDKPSANTGFEVSTYGEAEIPAETAASANAVIPGTTMSASFPVTGTLHNTSQTTVYTTASQTQPTAPCSVSEDENTASNLALGGKIATADQWTYLIDKRILKTGVRFHPDSSQIDYSHVETLTPENSNSKPNMVVVDQKLYYTGSSDNKQFLYVSDLSGANASRLSIELQPDMGMFHIRNNFIYYVDSQSVLKKADLNGNHQNALWNPIPSNYSLLSSRMASTEQDLYLMLADDGKREIDVFRISLTDNTRTRIQMQQFSNQWDYSQFCCNGRLLIPCNGWLYFCGNTAIYKLSEDGTTWTTIHISDHRIDSMLIHKGVLYYMEQGSLYSILLSNDTAGLLCPISPPFLHEGELLYEYSNISFLGCDDSGIYYERTELPDFANGSGNAQNRILVERIRFDGKDQMTLFSSTNAS